MKLEEEISNISELPQNSGNLQNYFGKEWQPFGFQ